VSTLHRFSERVYDSALGFFTAYQSRGLFLALQTPLIWIGEDPSKNLLSQGLTTDDNRQVCIALQAAVTQDANSRDCY